MPTEADASFDVLVIGAGFSGLYTLHRLRQLGIDPLAVDPIPPPRRRLIVGAWHDRMASRDPAIALQERWAGQVYWYDGGHVGHVFSRRVQRVTERFLQGVVN